MTGLVQDPDITVVAGFTLTAASVDDSRAAGPPRPNTRTSYSTCAAICRLRPCFPRIPRIVRYGLTINQRQRSMRGMFRISSTREISAPPDEVWAVLCDTEHYAEWVPGTDAVTRFDGTAASGVTYEEITPITYMLARYRVR
jgi:hypothetical protein